jgi:hypothetical protein
VDALNELDVAAEIRGVIAFVLEENSSHFVANKLCRLDGVLVRVQIVVPERPRCYCQLEITSAGSLAGVSINEQNMFTLQPCSHHP